MRTQSIAYQDGNVTLRGGVEIFPFVRRLKVARTVTLCLLLHVLPAMALYGCRAGDQPKVSDYTFARSLTNEELMNDAAKREAFVDQVLRAIADFMQPGVGFNPATGATNDGYEINPVTGDRVGTVRSWSAASKESLDVIVLAAAVYGDRQAAILVSKQDPAQAESKALRRLEARMTSYEKYNKDYEGFGGFITWYVNRNEGLRPTDDWQNRVPALDNGQLVWSLILASYVLKVKGYHDLAQRYENYWRMMASNAPIIFLEDSPGQLQVRAEARVHNNKARPERANYSNHQAKYFLDDPFEGQMMLAFLSLLCQLSPEEVRLIWQGVSLQSVTYTTARGLRITGRKGHVGSAHEEWARLVFPYSDIALINEIFVGTEKARTWWSADHNIPGLMAAVSPLENEGTEYLSLLGVPGLGKHEPQRRDIVAHYAAFPAILADEIRGLTWLRTSLAAPRGVSHIGFPEAVRIDGQKITPVATWDGNVTIAVALMNKRITKLMRDAMQQLEIYNNFVTLQRDYYARVFDINKLEGGTLDLAIPTTDIPLTHPDFR